MMLADARFAPSVLSIPKFHSGWHRAVNEAGVMQVPERCVRQHQRIDGVVAEQTQPAGAARRLADSSAPACRAGRRDACPSDQGAPLIGVGLNRSDQAHVPVLRCEDAPAAARRRRSESRRPDELRGCAREIHASVAGLAASRARRSARAARSSRLGENVGRGLERLAASVPAPERSAPACRREW